MSLSSAVVTARKKKGLTQEELSDLTNITVRTIQRIESGETTPRSYTLKAIAFALDIPFEALHSTGNHQQVLVGMEVNSKTINLGKDSNHFLQLFCLSCFSYLVLPIIHFLIPVCLLRKRNEQNQLVLAYARRMIRIQIYWVITLHAVLLLTVAYNVLCSTYLNASYTINYLVPFFIMYLVNALIISAALARSRKMAILPS